MAQQRKLPVSKMAGEQKPNEETPIEQKPIEEKKPTIRRETTYIHRLGNYIKTKGAGSSHNKVINYAEADQALGFPQGTSKRCFKQALQTTNYSITAHSEEVVQLEDR